MMDDQQSPKPQRRISEPMQDIPMFGVLCVFVLSGLQAVGVMIALAAVVPSIPVSSDATPNAAAMFFCVFGAGFSAVWLLTANMLVRPGGPLHRESVWPFAFPLHALASAMVLGYLVSFLVVLFNTPM